MAYPDNSGTNFNINWQPPQSQTAPPFSQTQATLPRYQIALVDGEKGANDFPMGPNSSIFLADKTNRNRIWLCTTDEMGFKRVRPIDSKMADEPGEEIEDFSKRLKRLEDIVNERLVNTRGNKSKPTASDPES